jgi:hypothetical protein
MRAEAHTASLAAAARYMGNGGVSMAKVVITKLDARTAREIGGKGGAVTTRRVGNGSGQFTTLRTLDSGSESFGRDFTRVFGANVKKAREENKRVTGAPDRVPGKR